MGFRQKSSPLAVPRLSLSICSWSFYFFDFLPFLSSRSCPTLPCGFAVVFISDFYGKSRRTRNVSKRRFSQQFLATNRLCVRDYAKRDRSGCVHRDSLGVCSSGRPVGQLAACAACVWLKLNDSAGSMCDMTIKTEAFRGAIAKTTTQFGLITVRGSRLWSWRRSLGNCTINSLRFWRIIPSVWLQISLRCFWVKGSWVSSRLLFCSLQWNLASLTFDIVELKLISSLLCLLSETIWAAATKNNKIQKRSCIRIRLQAPTNPIFTKIHSWATASFS